MASPVFAFVSSLARKLAMAVLIAGLTLVVYALWLFISGRGDYAEQRALRIAAVEVRHAAASTQLEEVTLKTNVTIESLNAQRQRFVQAEKTLKSLHSLDPSTFQRLVGDKAQQATHDERIARTERIKTETQTHIVDLQREVVTGEMQRVKLANEVDVLSAELNSLHVEKRAATHYLRTAWHDGAWIVYAVFFAYLFGGLLVAILLYFGWAQLMANRRVMQLRKGELPLPTFSECGTLNEHMLWPGERLWVRRAWLLSADTALMRKKRLMPDWRWPFSWWLSGCSGLLELRNERSDGERQVVFSDKNDPFAELVTVSVPEGGAFIVRASHLIGLIANTGRSPVIQRHWRFASWCSWVAGRFGYFEFYGPCRLVVSCVSTVQHETLNSPDEKNPLAVRIPVAGLVGFSPQLALLPVRTKGFWRFFRNEKPLFELQLSGRGSYLIREVDHRGGDGFKARILRRFGV